MEINCIEFTFIIYFRPKMLREIVSLTVWTFGAIPITFTAYILYKRRNKRKREPLQNKDYEVGYWNGKFLIFPIFC